MSALSSQKKLFALDPFGQRQFNNPSYTGTQVYFDEKEFEERINTMYEAGGIELKDGYASFCKHLFVPNFAKVKCGYATITAENKSLIESCYEARKADELPVLIQYIPKEVFEPQEATYLDIILYSRDQIIKENIAMGSQPPASDAPWGIISVKGQLCDYELPMQPITMMRNALGKEYGGSGVPIELNKYKESVEFWEKNVSIK
eukprot:gene8305-11236_t